MRGTKSSRAALVMSGLALFVALGGSAIAFTQIGTNQIRNQAVTAAKIHDGAVWTRKLPNGAVTASKVAKNTFLPFTGTAANASELGGLPASQYMRGRGFMLFHRLVVPSGGTNQELLDPGFGNLTASCTANHPSVTWTPDRSNDEFAATITNYGMTSATVYLDTENGIAANTPYTSSEIGSGPWSITFQIGFNDGTLDHVTTISTTGRFEFGTGCVIIAQGPTTG